MKRRLIVDALAEGELRLTEEQAHYVRRVLRVAPPATLELCDGAGRVADATLVDGGALTVHAVHEAPPPRPHITLLQAVPKGDKMDTVVRQATELGVQRIVPVSTERVVARGRGRGSRWSGIAEDAIRVSRRAHRPKIEAVTPLHEVLSGPRGDLSLCLALHPDAVPLAEAAQGAPSRIEVLVGPEGGLTPDETQRARDAGFWVCHLGPHPLRTETAGPAVIAMLQLVVGALSP